MGAMGEPAFNSVEWLEKELERLQYADTQWARLFDEACHDRDVWRQQEEDSRIIISQYQLLLRNLKHDMAIRTQQFDALLEAVGGIPVACSDVLTPQCLTKAQQRINERNQAARDQGSHSGEAQSGGATEGHRHQGYYQSQNSRGA